MTIAGKEIDLKKLFDQAEKEAMEIKYYHSEALDGALRRIEGDLYSVVWNGILDELGASTRQDNQPNAEAAVAALIHHGVDKESIIYRRNKFKIPMPNLYYNVRRDVHGFYSAPVHNFNEYHIRGLGAEDFADLVFEFDAIVPELNVIRDRIFEKYRKDVEERQKQLIIRKLAETTVDTVLSNILKPLGYEYKREIKGNNVKVFITQTKETDFEVPISELAEKLSDIQALIDSMKVVKRETKKPNGRFGGLESMFIHPGDKCP